MENCFKAKKQIFHIAVDIFNVRQKSNDKAKTRLSVKHALCKYTYHPSQQN